MKRFLTGFAVFMLETMAAVMFATTGVNAQQTAQSAGDPVRGKANFMAYGCYECHGTAGQGNYFGGPKIAPHPLALAALLAYIREPAGQMPSYSTVILTDKEATDIWSYLSNLPAAKPVDAIPILAGVKTTPK